MPHYLHLGKTYRQLGNIDGAREALTMAHALCKRFSDDAEQLVAIKHQIAEIDMTRFDLRRAQRTYEEILELRPHDERARRQLIDIHFGQGNSNEAVKRLDELLSQYAREKQVGAIVKTLEELVRLYPDEIALRSRLAGLYRQTGRNSEAITQLDALGELQLKAGLTQEAVVTIKQLVKLGPTNANQYLQLLRQLER
jgi:tetratricopeptide (TPR) repeat protein